MVSLRLPDVDLGDEPATAFDAAIETLAFEHADLDLSADGLTRQTVMVDQLDHRASQQLQRPAGATFAKVGLAREIEAKPGALIWRRDDAGQGYALKLTAAGLKAIALDERSPDAIEPGETPQPQQRMAPVRTKAASRPLWPPRETAASWRW